MSQNTLEKLRKYLPFWEYYKANKCIPPINLPTLEAIAAIYQQTLHPAPVRLYCSVCVEEMITTLFHQYERDIVKTEELRLTNQKDIHEPKDGTKSKTTQTEKLLSPNDQKKNNFLQNTGKKRRGRKVRRKKVKK